MEKVVWALVPTHWARYVVRVSAPVGLMKVFPNKHAIALTPWECIKLGQTPEAKILICMLMVIEG